LRPADDVIAVLEQTRRPSVEAPAGGGYEDEPPSPAQLDAEADQIRERIAALLSPSPFIATSSCAKPRRLPALSSQLSSS
jgi:DNA processing protein